MIAILVEPTMRNEFSAAFPQFIFGMFKEKKNQMYVLN